jgi:histone H3
MTKKIKNNDSNEIKKKGYRYKPGTVSLKKIRKFQKSAEPLTALTKTKRRIINWINNKGNKFEDGIRVSKKFVEGVRYMGENNLVNLLQDLNLIGINGKRIAPQTKDFETWLQLIGPTKINLTTDPRFRKRYDPIIKGKTQIPSYQD